MHRDDAVVAALFRETHEILRPLSREDFASYLAREHQTGRTVDLNVLPGTLDKAAAFRFMRNMPLVARLKHPGIQPLAGFGAMGDAHYWAIEHFDGPSMATILQRGPRDVRETLTFAATVC